MIPTKLKQGDEIRIVAPSTSLAVVAEEQRHLATAVLNEMGLYVTFSKHALECDDFLSSSVQARIEDLHEAFRDPQVKGILTTLGGFNVNQLLRYLDYDLIRKNPKVICGYSDITALCNAIYQKTGLVTYSGPHFSTFAMKQGFSYTKNYFQACLMDDSSIIVESSQEWSDDAWYLNQETRCFLPNEGPVVIQEGSSEGRIVGGNLCTLNLLQGTEYMPDLHNTILFIEDDDLVDARIFDRDLQSLLQINGANGIQGVLIGRFQRKSNMSMKLLQQIIWSKEELYHLPVLANINFGHTSPIITFPIGGTIKVSANQSQTHIEISIH